MSILAEPSDIWPDGEVPPLAEALPLFSQHDFDASLERLPMPVGLKSSYPAEYCRRIAAAAISYQMSLSSIDYTKKRYLADVVYEENGDTRLDNRITHCIREISEKIYKYVFSLAPLGEENIGTFMAQITIVRARASLAAVLTLANRGLQFEAIAVARMLLEQLAWAYAANGNDDDEDVRQISATRSINRLKTAHSRAGDFYGWLSDYAHWAYHAHVQVLGEETEQSSAIMASCRFKARGLSVALITADCLAFVTAYAFPVPGCLAALRPNLQQIRDYAVELSSLLPDDEPVLKLTGFLLPLHEQVRE